MPRSISCLSSSTFFLHWCHRQYERAACKAFTRKERIIFLRRRLDEKVLPRIMLWLYKTDHNHPFPAAAYSVLRAAISSERKEADCHFYNMRKSRRHLKGHLLIFGVPWMLMFGMWLNIVLVEVNYTLINS